MNGWWYPWGSAGIRRLQDFIAAWRHIHDVFARQRVTNVIWSWDPSHQYNTPYARQGRLAGERVVPGQQVRRLGRPRRLSRLRHERASAELQGDLRLPAARHQADRAEQARLPRRDGRGARTGGAQADPRTVPRDQVLPPGRAGLVRRHRAARLDRQAEGLPAAAQAARGRGLHEACSATSCDEDRRRS